jgi:hypothetical protein
MKSHEFIPEAHLTDPKAQPKPASQMKPANGKPRNGALPVKKTK